MVFQNLVKIEMTQNKNQLFGRHFETVQRLILFFCRIVISYCPYIYGANFIAKFRWENGFESGGGSLGTNGSKSTLVTLVLMINFVWMCICYLDDIGLHVWKIS